jgi:hypothetical protein
MDEPTKVGTYCRNKGANASGSIFRVYRVYYVFSGEVSPLCPYVWTGTSE